MARPSNERLASTSRTRHEKDDVPPVHGLQSQWSQSGPALDFHSGMSRSSAGSVSVAGGRGGLPPSVRGKQDGARQAVPTPRRQGEGEHGAAARASRGGGLVPGLGP